MNHRKSRRAHRLHFQTLERRNLLAGDIGHNFVEAEDVNLDGNVSALDALNIINNLAQQANNAEGETTGDTTLLADVDQSGEVTAGDALRVINRLGQDERDAESLEEGVDQLASAILTEDLPPGMRPQTAEAWLENLEERIEAPAERRTAFDRLDDNGDGELTEDEVSEEQWDRISQADADETGSVTPDELKAARPTEGDVQRPADRSAFDHLDANEDGSLTEDEVSERAWDRLSRADANEDGAVTQDEISAAREDSEEDVQKPTPQEAFDRLDVNEDGALTEDEVREEKWVKISKADGNEDGAVTLEELQAARDEREKDVQKPTPEEVFAHLDANEDGQLTEDEVTERVWARLSKADANEDGAVTLEELKAAREEREEDVQKPSPEEVFANLDANEDGQLTEDEVTERVWARLSKADANEDGAVTLEELQAARDEREEDVQKPTPEEVFAHLDANEDGQLTEDEVTERVWARLSKADANEDGAVTLEELKAAREEREEDVQKPSPEEVFAHLDANEDGQLTEDEVTERVWARLSKADGNEDGAVTLEELQAARDEREEDVQKPTPEEVFAHLDANEDGQLTEDEVTEEKWARISRADANEDGAVTLEELQAARDTNEDDVDGPSADHAHPAFDRLDANGDGAISEDEVRAEAWARLSAADANADGLVTLNEIQANGGGGGQGGSGGQGGGAGGQGGGPRGQE